MKYLVALIILYVSPGCLPQCVNCAPQQTYSSPCCIPPTNVQTIQSARAFTNGAQGSQVIMYYNGQRIVAGQQPSPQISNYEQNPTGNYQNPGPIPGYQNQNSYQTDQSQYPNNLNGGVVGGGAGGAVVGGVGIQGGPQEVGGNIYTGDQNQNVNAGGNIGNQNQNINAGGNIAQNQNGFVSQNQNPNDGLNNYQGSTLSPSAAEIGYQPFVPSGNDGYNVDGTNNFNNGQEQYGGQQQDQQGQYSTQQNNQNVIYPAGGIAAGGAVGGSYNSPNSGYVNSQVQPQTYPTQVVTGGAVPNQNVQQQPNVNTPYQDQMNNQNGGTYLQNNPQNAEIQNQGAYNNNQQNVPGNQNQQQTFTAAPVGQGQQGFDPNNQFGGSSTSQSYQQDQFSSTPSYQQGNQQQQYTTPGQQGYTNGQQGYNENTDLPVLNPQDQSQSTVTEPTSSYSPLSSVTPYPVIFPSQDASQITTSTPTLSSPQSEEQQFFQPTTVSSINNDAMSSTVPNGESSTSQLDSTTDSPHTETVPVPVPVPIPVPVPTNQNENNETVPLEATTIAPQNDYGVTGLPSTSGPYQVGIGGQGQSSTNSYQYTTPTTINYSENGVTTAGQQQPLNEFQSTTGVPVTNDNQGFITSSTNPNMPQAQYPSQQNILAYTGQSTTGSSISSSTQVPQFPSQQEQGASTVATPAPQFPAQQDLMAASSVTPQNDNFQNQQENNGATPQFPSQQELIQRDQQQSGGATVNNSGFTPQYNDMNTQYGRYSSTTGSPIPQFDQPIADQQQIENTAAFNMNLSMITILLACILF